MVRGVNDMAMSDEELEKRLREVVEDLGRIGVIEIIDEKNFKIPRKVVKGTLDTILSLALYGTTSLPENFAKITEMTPEDIVMTAIGLYFADEIIQEHHRLGFSREEAMTFEIEYFSMLLTISSAIIDIIKKQDPKTYNMLITAAKKLQEIAKKTSNGGE